MEDLLWHLNLAATILGYYTLVSLVALGLFVAIQRVQELTRDRRRKSHEEEEWWERARSQWIFEDYTQDQYDTDILDFPSTVEYEAVSYLEENERRGRRKAR